PLPGPLARSGPPERHPGAPTPLVLDRRDVALAADVAQIERCRCADSGGRYVLDCDLAPLQRSVHLLEARLTRRRCEAESLVAVRLRELRHRSLARLPGSSGLLDCLLDPFQVDSLCHVCLPVSGTGTGLRGRAPRCPPFVVSVCSALRARPQSDAAC